MAVGYTLSASPGPSLAERWNGSHWVVEPTPDLSPAYPNLNAVSCTAPDACTAVGNQQRGGAPQAPLAERWDGTRWSVQPFPGPSGGSLNAVSCVSNHLCMAVGLRPKTSSGFGTLAERWDGSVWSVQPTPNPAGRSE
jgi:hypothetical protein